MFTRLSNPQNTSSHQHIIPHPTQCTQTLDCSFLFSALSHHRPYSLSAGRTCGFVRVKNTGVSHIILGTRNNLPISKVEKASLLIGPECAGVSTVKHSVWKYVQEASAAVQRTHWPEHCAWGTDPHPTSNLLLLRASWQPAQPGSEGLLSVSRKHGVSTEPRQAPVSSPVWPVASWPC